MTLDEAIEHHKWAAENSEGAVSKEHERYVSWLTQLRDENNRLTEQLIHEAVKNDTFSTIIENVDLRRLLSESVLLLNGFCQKERGCGSDCPAWSHEKNQCKLNDINDRSRRMRVAQCITKTKGMFSL